MHSPIVILRFRLQHHHHHPDIYSSSWARKAVTGQYEYGPLDGKELIARFASAVLETGAGHHHHHQPGCPQG